MNNNHSEKNNLSPEQWVALLNGYYYNKEAAMLAEQIGLNEVDVQIWYCRFALAVTAYALKLCNKAKQKAYFRLIPQKHVTTSIPVFLVN